MPKESQVTTNYWPQSFAREGYGKEAIIQGGRSTKPQKAAAPKAPNPDDILAAITAEDYKNFEQDFVPVMESVVSEITDKDSPRQAALQAEGLANDRFNRDESIWRRQVQRTGTTIEADQEKRIQDKLGLARGRNTVNAANMARRYKEDENLGTMQSMIESGQSLRGNALQGLGAASGMQAQREAAGASLAAQQQQGFWGNVGTGAGFGFAIGGPVGGAVGAGIGALVSLF